MDKFLKFLAEKRARAVERRERADAEIAEIDRTEKMYRASGAAAQATAHERIAQPPEQSVMLIPEAVSLPPGHLSGTIKARVLAILANNPMGLTSSQILNVLQITGLPELERESLSPQLSRLRNADRKIDLNHGVWTLKKHESQGV